MSPEFVTKGTMNWKGKGFVERLNKTYERIVRAVKRIENIEIGHKSFVTENH